VNILIEELRDLTRIQLNKNSVNDGILSLEVKSASNDFE
jgi:hypothetical protein